MMNEYDAFPPVGEINDALRTRHEIKLLVCYILDSIDVRLTKDRLNDIMQSRGLANYFEANQALSELISVGNVNVDFSDGQEYLTLTEFGAAALRELASDLPHSVREKAMNSAVALVTREKREHENRVDVVPHGDGFNVTFTLSAEKDALMTLTVYAADEKQVEKIKDGFYADPVGLYSGIIAFLTA